MKTATDLIDRVPPDNDEPPMDGIDNSDSPEESASQTWWKEAAGELREALRKRIENVPGMLASDLPKLVDALRDALWLDHYAHEFDDELARDAARGPFDH